MNAFLPYTTLCSYRVVTSEDSNLPDVVNQTVEGPLNVDLGSTSQGEVIHSFARSDISEHRFHDTKTFAVGLAPLRRIDLLLHLIYEASGSPTDVNVDLPCSCLLTTQALRTQYTAAACAFRRLIGDEQVALYLDSVTSNIQPLVCRTDQLSCLIIQCEILGAEPAFL